MSYSPPRLRAHTSQRATGRFGACSAAPVLAIMLALLIPGPVAAAQPPASAGWHGRAIAHPHHHSDTVAVAQTSFPRGWSAGPVQIGAGFRHQDGSARVREVQQRLWALGFRPGPVDGLFGSQTQAAVEWFQIKHGIRPDGVVDLRTLSHLRERTGATPLAGPYQEPVRGGRSAARGNAPQPQAAMRPADGSQKSAGEHHSGVAPWELVALALLLLAAPAALSLRRHSTPKPRRPDADRKVAAGPAPQPPRKPRRAEADRKAAPAVREAAPAVREAAPAVREAAPAVREAAPAVREAAPQPKPKPRRPDVDRKVAAEPKPQPAPVASVERLTAIGYVRTRDRTDRAELARHAGAIRQACTSRGWQLGELIRDDQPGAGRTIDRPGLAAAMERLSAPGASRLVVSSLAHLSRSAEDLMALFEWFGQNDVQVIATDVGLDTTTPQGREAAQKVLAAVARRQAQAPAKRRNGARKRAKVEVGAGAGGGSRHNGGDPG